jgi:hypothetical protein
LFEMTTEISRNLLFILLYCPSVFGERTAIVYEYCC